jgi:hypothetical protein
MEAATFGLLESSNNFPFETRAILDRDLLLDMTTGWDSEL